MRNKRSLTAAPLPPLLRHDLQGVVWPMWSSCRLASPKLALVFAAAILAAGNQAPAQKPAAIRQVRNAAEQKNWAEARRILDAFEKDNGRTSAWLEAYSWIARGRLFAEEYGEAVRVARDVEQQALALLKTRKLGGDASLAIALGAAIEVQGLALDAQGQKSEAVAYLQQQLKRYYSSPIRARIQKNLHLVSLEGRAAPALAVAESVGPNKPVPLSSLRGRKVLMFFWAHWCGDCKGMAATMARISKEFPNLAIVGPTQPYGYIAGGEEAPRPREVAYIEETRAKYYGAIERMSVPVSEENFKLWGASTTPTLAVIDKTGIVRLYHPGSMTYDELVPYLRDEQPAKPSSSKTSGR
ncbi:MAG: TlpA family protein disulfide reductase [Bryobacteraceae bacterium]|nr:TlpA family protein disulfide reductase [Bryobacteraceae bacterium]